MSRWRKPEFYQQPGAVIAKEQSRLGDLETSPERPLMFAGEELEQLGG